MQPLRARAGELAVGLPVALLGGLAVGTMTTFKHRLGVNALEPGGVPYGLFLGVLLVGLFLGTLRVLLPTRLYAWVAAAGVLLAVVALSLPGPGGSTVVFGWVGTAWQIAPAVVVAAVLGFPRIRRASASAPAGPSGADGILGPSVKEENEPA